MVGQDEIYQFTDAIDIFNSSNATYVWNIWKKKSGTWINITNKPPKMGQKVSFKFGEKVLGEEFKLEVFKATPKIFSDEFEAKSAGEFFLVPTSSKVPKIDKVILFNQGAKDPNKASYRDTLVAKAYCIAMFNQEVEFRLWEDDAPEGGHNPQINKNNQAPIILKARVNKNGIAEKKISLMSNASVLKALANKYMMNGDKNEGANHEYYVTASYAGKIHKASQVNVDVANPDHKPKSPQKPQTASKKPSTNVAVFSGTSSKAPKQDSEQKITHAYFVDLKGNPVKRIKVGDSVRIRIKTVNMIGENLQFIVKEYDLLSENDKIAWNNSMKIIGDAVDTPVITITPERYDRGIDNKILYDYDKVEQQYFIEIIPLGSKAKSKSFGLDDEAKRIKVENGKSAVVVNPTVPSVNCVCKNPTLYWGKNFTCKERKKIIEISKRLLCDPNYLTSAMALETGGKFDPSIVNSLGYTGLIQIGSVAAEDVNRRKKTNVSAGNNGNLKNMSKLDQLTYVEYYLEPFKGKLNTLADFYLAVLMPVDCGRGAEIGHVVFDKNITLDYDKAGKVIKNTKWVRQRAYAQNPVFHKEGKKEAGQTFVWEIAAEIQRWYDKGDANKETSFSCQEITKDKIEDKGNGIWHNPVDNPRLTKYNYSGINKPSSGSYGWCRRNPDGSKKYHSGFDFFAIPEKDKVYSCLKGNVHQVRYSTSAGWIVRIKIQNVKDLLEQEKKINYTTQYKDELKGINIIETDDVFFIYMHLDSAVVNEEDAKNKKEIDAGTILGYAGVSGSIASGGKAPHLHLEIATVLDAYGHGESVRTNPARFVKLNSYDTKDQDDEAKKKHTYKK